MKKLSTEKNALETVKNEKRCKTGPVAAILSAKAKPNAYV